MREDYFEDCDCGGLALELNLVENDDGMIMKTDVGMDYMTL